MPPVDRNKPVRAKGSDSSYSLMEFVREFPDDAACLRWLWETRCSADGERAHCPKCDRERKFHKVSDRPAWDCDSCGYHLHPTAGTIFHKSSTSLHLWFYGIYLMTSTRCGISAKQLERELGVTYKTAWRMFNRIRNVLMADDGEPLDGEVEVDETSVEGRPRVNGHARPDTPGHNHGVDPGDAAPHGDQGRDLQERRREVPRRYPRSAMRSYHPGAPLTLRRAEPGFGLAQ